MRPRLRLWVVHHLNRGDHREEDGQAVGLGALAGIPDGQGSIRVMVARGRNSACTLLDQRGAYRSLDKPWQGQALEMRAPVPWLSPHPPHGPSASASLSQTRYVLTGTSLLWHQRQEGFSCIVPPSTKRQKKEVKRDTDGQEKIQLPLFKGEMIVYVENPK